MMEKVGGGGTWREGNGDGRWPSTLQAEVARSSGDRRIGAGGGALGGCAGASGGEGGGLVLDGVDCCDFDFDFDFDYNYYDGDDFDGCDCDCCD